VLGVLGLGAIGRALGDRAAAFGMRVLGTKRTVDVIASNACCRPRARMRPRSEYLVILPPLTQRGDSSTLALGLMKRTAVLINVGRGQIVNEDALIDALRRGTIAGAGLDVFEREPLPADSPLYEMENVIVTPHVAGASHTYYDRAIPIFCENLRRHLDGQSMLNVVEPARGY
jgi:phosphoglycerate dehydrogenase-like enzyme